MNDSIVLFAGLAISWNAVIYCLTLPSIASNPLFFLFFLVTVYVPGIYATVDYVYGLFDR